jgi:phage protein D
LSRVVTLKEESARQGGFYVPRFEIKVAGASLPLDVLRDVMQVTYKDSVKELDSFEVTVNNWDADKKQFKYVGAETADSLKKNPLHNLFNPCGHEVDLLMGYGSKPLTLMLRGNFTTMEPNFPSGGGSTLAVRGLNVLHKLRTSRHSYFWEKQTPSAIALSMPKLPQDNTPGKNRFPVQVDIDAQAAQSEHPIDYIAQTNQFDIEFLLALALRMNYVVFVKEEEKNGDTHVKERRLYFGPSDGNNPSIRPVTFELKWGLSLIDFKPTLTTANQIKSVTVNGFNRDKKTPIAGTATVESLTVNDDERENFASCDAREERVEDEPYFTQGQAEERAKNLLRQRNRDMVKASGTCIGLPDLRAGRCVVIGNLGSRFSGRYFVTETTHTISDSGYITKFNARRENPDKGIS